MIKVFCGFALAAVLALLVLPGSMRGLCLDMASIYLGLAVLTALLQLVSLSREQRRARTG